MKTIRQRLFSFLVVSVAAFVFAACSNEQITSLDEDAITQDIIGGTQCEVSSLQVNNSDYEVIPVGANNYVYVPKMTSAKSTTRSVETARTYSSSVVCTEVNLIVTITWDDTSATFRLSDGYMYALQDFRYSINGSSINIDELWLRIYGGSGAHLCDVRYSGTLNGK